QPEGKEVDRVPDGQCDVPILAFPGSVYGLAGGAKRRFSNLLVNEQPAIVMKDVLDCHGKGLWQDLGMWT
ncbi:hypothetical protein STEG23_001256, partial [Scotinomys teguina]